MFNQVVMQLKRECWEHTVLLIKGPAILAATLLVVAAITMAYFFVNSEVDSRPGGSMGLVMKSDATWLFDSANASEMAHLPLKEREFNLRPAEEVKASNSSGSVNVNSAEFSALLDWCFMAIIGLVLAMSLYSDRQDNRVLFWRSLRVSETRHVLTKFLFGSAVIPAAFYFFCLLTLTGLALLASLFDWLLGSHWPLGEAAWITVKQVGHDMIFFPVTLFWLLPIVSLLMVCGVFGKKYFLLFAPLPFLIVMAVEYLIFQTNSFGELFRGYLVEGWSWTLAIHKGQEYSFNGLTMIWILLTTLAGIALSIWGRQVKLD